MNDEDDGDDFNWEDDEQPTANVEVSELKTKWFISFIYSS